LVALVTQAVPELLGDGLGDVGLALGDGSGLLGLADGEVGSGLGDDVVGSGLGDLLGTGVLGAEDGETELELGVGDDVLGGCEWVGFPKVGPPVARRATGPQPASTTVVAHTAIAGQICFFFTSRLLTC
jgi:hypothetical protein